MAMRIYISYSNGGLEIAEKYAKHIRNSNNDFNVSLDDSSELARADGVLICISGTENSNVKAELNMALDRKLPVAYIREVKSLDDSGVKLQLGLAQEIEPGDFVRLDGWLKNIGEEAVKRKKSQKRKKTASVITVVLVLMILAVSTVFAIRHISDAKSSGSEASDAAEQSETRDELAEDNLSSIYLGDNPASLKVLNLSNKGLSDISFLSSAVNLEELDISKNNISDINILVTLKNLKKLDISDNPIEDYTILDYLKGVEIKR